MQLIKSATVALGAFNPAIPTPHWLAQQKILEHGTFEQGTVLTQQGAVTRFRRGQLVWMVTLDRLVVETSDEGDRERPVALTSKILAALPHTPVRAIGINFDFALDEPTDGVRATMKGIDFGDLPGTRTATNVSVVNADAVTGTQLKVQLIESEGEARAAFNFHRDVASAPAAIEYLEGASKFYENARTIAARLEK